MRAVDWRDGRAGAEFVARLDRLTDLPLTLLAMLLALLQIIPTSELANSPARDPLSALGWAILAVFAAQLAVKLLLVPNRPAYLRRHWLDAAIVLMPALQFLTTNVVWVRLLWGLVAGARGLVGLRRVLRHLTLVYLGFVVLLMVGVAVDLVVDAEKQAGDHALIRNSGDAIWWVFVTMSSTGYGDKYPLTATGRVIGVGLMLLGIALFGLLTAQFAKFFILAEENKLELGMTDLDSRLRRIETALGKQATRQKELAGKAMRIAKRTRERNKRGDQRDDRAAARAKSSGRAAGEEGGSRRSARRAARAAGEPDARGDSGGRRRDAAEQAPGAGGAAPGGEPPSGRGGEGRGRKRELGEAGIREPAARTGDGEAGPRRRGPNDRGRNGRAPRRAAEGGREAPAEAPISTPTAATPSRSPTPRSGEGASSGRAPRASRVRRPAARRGGARGETAPPDEGSSTPD